MRVQEAIRERYEKWRGHEDEHGVYRKPMQMIYREMTQDMIRR